MTMKIVLLMLFRIIITTQESERIAKYTTFIDSADYFCVCRYQPSSFFFLYYNDNSQFQYFISEDDSFEQNVDPAPFTWNIIEYPKAFGPNTQIDILHQKFLFIISDNYNQFFIMKLDGFSLLTKEKQCHFIMQTSTKEKDLLILLYHNNSASTFMRLYKESPTSLNQVEYFEIAVNEGKEYYHFEDLYCVITTSSIFCVYDQIKKYFRLWTYTTDSLTIDLVQLSTLPLVDLDYQKEKRAYRFNVVAIDSYNVLVCICYSSSNGYALYCEAASINQSVIRTSRTGKSTPFRLIDNCRNSNYIYVTLFDTNRIAAICRGYGTEMRMGYITIKNNDFIVTGTDYVKDLPVNQINIYQLKLSNNFFIAFYNLNSKVIYQYLNYPYCNDYSLDKFVNNKKCDLLLQNNILSSLSGEKPEYFIKFEPSDSAKQSVILYTSDENVIDYSKQYSNDEFYFDSGSVACSLSYFVYLQTKDGKTFSKCSITFTINSCYKGCFSCDTYGTSIYNTKCIECDNANGYYPLEDKIEQCYHKDIKVNHYYYDNNIFKKCNVACLQCSSLGSSSEDTQCEKCDSDNGYYAVEDKEGLCQNSIPLKYYFDASAKMYKKCFNGCYSCNEKGDFNNMKCTSCDNDNFFYPLIDKESQCYSTKEENKYIYYDELSHKFKHCNSACLKCSEFGSSIHSTKCTECDILNNYYPFKDPDNLDDSQCYHKNFYIEGYQIINKVFVPSSSYCKAIHNQYRNNEALYDKCLSKCPFNYAIDEDSLICYNCTLTNNTYLDSSNRKCIKDFPNNYYMFNNETDKILYKCYIDCSIEDSELDYFCFNENITHKCNSIIRIDKKIQIHYSPMDDETLSSYGFFIASSPEIQKTILKDTKDTIINLNSNNKSCLSELFYLNQLLLTQSSETQENYFNVTKEIIKDAFNSVDDIFNKEDKTIAITSSLCLYSELVVNKDSIDKSFVLDINSISSKMLSAYKKNIDITKDNQWIYDDFSLILGNSIDLSSKIVNSFPFDVSYNKTLFEKNATYRMNNSVMFNKERTSMKEVIEEFSHFSSYNNKVTALKEYSEVSFVSTSFEDIINKGYNQEKVSISIRGCDNKEKFIEQINRQDLTIKLCIPYEDLIKQYPTADKISIIEYKKYPILNPNTFNDTMKQFTSIVIRDKEGNNMNITNLNQSIVMIFKKSKTHFSNCIFYNDYNQSFDASNCTTEIINKDYIYCSCNHLTDFSLSKYNPLKIIDDIALLFSQARIIKSFSTFKLLSPNNAYVLYTISAILLIYFILLFFTLRTDLKRESFFYTLVNKKTDGCCSESEKEEEIQELQHQISKEERHSHHQQMIEMTEVKDTNNNKKPSLNKSLHIQSKQIISIGKHEYILFKSLFIKEYWLCTFLNGEDDMSKTNVITIFVVHLISSLSICSIFTECSIENELNKDMFTNRDLAVAVVTVLLLEVPFMLFEFLLEKTKIPISLSSSINRIRINTIYRYIIVYTVFVVIVIFGTLNTTWISLDSLNNGAECKFIKDFFISIVFDCFVYQILILVIKSIIYLVVMREKNSCIRRVMLCIVSSLPWIFNLNG